MMNVAIWLVIVIVVLYSMGFAVTLWRDNSKVGAITMLVLAVAIVVTPFFSVLR